MGMHIAEVNKVVCGAPDVSCDRQTDCQLFCTAQCLCWWTGMVQKSLCSSLYSGMGGYGLGFRVQVEVLKVIVAVKFAACCDVQVAAWQCCV